MKSTKKANKKTANTSKGRNNTSGIASSGRHTVKLSENEIKYIDLREGDELEDLAEEFQMGLWQFLKYNDLNKEDQLPLGYKLYLQPKRGKAKKDFHIVEKGQTMWQVSQIHGVKLKSLYKKNRMEQGQEPKVGEKIYLKSKKPN